MINNMYKLTMYNIYIKNIVNYKAFIRDLPDKQR